MFFFSESVSALQIDRGHGNDKIKHSLKAYGRKRRKIRNAETCFAGFKGGIGAALGSTGGYIVGFIFTALIAGIVADKFKGKLVPTILGMVAGVVACYIFGTAWFAIVYLRQGTPESIGTILGWCVIPFIIPDLVKVILAGILSNRLKKFTK